VAHTCNPSYSGGRDQENCSSSQPGEIAHETLSQKTLHKNRTAGVAQGEGPEFEPQYHKKMKERKEGRKEGRKKKKRKKGFMEVRQCILVGVFVSWLLPYWGWSLGPLAC
jgi:hypothetical protein